MTTIYRPSFEAEGLGLLTIERQKAAIDRLVRDEAANYPLVEPQRRRECESGGESVAGGGLRKQYVRATRGRPRKVRSWVHAARLNDLCGHCGAGPGGDSSGGRVIILIARPIVS